MHVDCPRAPGGAHPGKRDHKLSDMIMSKKACNKTLLECVGRINNRYGENRAHFKMRQLLNLEKNIYICTETIYEQHMPQ